MLHRLQSAIEFLSVYGFVILIIAIALALLVVLSGLPKTAIPIQCSFFTGFVCNDAIYTINTVSNTGSVLIIAAADTEPGTLNISSFSAFMGFTNSTSGYCVPNVAQQGEIVYCVANFGLTPTLGSAYSGTFQIKADYCPAAPNLITNVTCPAISATNGNYIYGGSVSITATRISVGGTPGGATGPYHVPMVIPNTQNSAIPPQVQEMISFLPSSSSYNAFERSDLGNIRFYYNSKELFSWCESNCISTATSNAIFWVKLPVGIPSGQSVIVNMYFVPLSVDYDGVYAGEAPQLSSVYGLYDNGANVFNNYWNFAGSTLPTGWVAITGSAYTINKGVSFSGASTVIGTSVKYPISGILESNFRATTQAAGGMTYAVDVNGNQYASSWLTMGTGAGQLYNGQVFDLRSASSGTVAGGSFGSVTTGAATGNYIAGIVVSSTSNAYFYINENSVANSLTNVPAQNNYYIELGSNGGVFSLNWVRTRLYPISIGVSTSTSTSTTSTTTSTSTAASTSITSTTTSTSTTTTIISSNVLYYVPITLQNSQTSAFLANAQIMIPVSSLVYQSYETGNLMNTEFFFANGTVMPSYLEGSVSNTLLNTAANSIYLSTSTNTIYWVRIYPSNTFLCASCSNTIYLGFASTSTNLLSNTITGEAPQLSSTYGKYDNGANIFTVYQNFVGTSTPSGWTTSGTGISQNNGVAVSYGSAGSYIQTSATYGLNANQIMDFYANFPIGNVNDNWAGYVNSGCHVASINCVGWDTRPGDLSSGYAMGVASTTSSWTKETTQTATGLNLWSVYWPSSSSVVYNYNYGTAATITTTIPTSALHIGVTNTADPSVPTITLYFMKLRAYPPNGVMPSTSFGAVCNSPNCIAATPNPYTLTNTVINTGQISIANTVISGGSAGTTLYTGNWLWIPPTTSNIVAGNTIIAALPTNNALTLTINAVSSNSLKMTFNGITYYANVIGTNTVYGTWTFNAFAGDANGDLSPSPALTNTISVTTPSIPPIAYVANAGSSTVNVIDVVSNSVVNTITVGTPYGLAFTPSGNLAYAPNSGSGTSVIDVASNSVVRTITVGTDPRGVAFTPSGNLAYVANLDAGTVSVIDVVSNSVVKTISVGSPYAVAFTPSGNLAYVTDYSSATVSVIDVVSNSVVKTISVGTTPYGVAITPSGNLAYVTNQGSGTVSVIDVVSNSVVKTISVGTNPDNVAFTSSGNLAYVTNQGSGTVSVIGVVSNTIVNTISGFSTPVGVAFTPSGNLAYVTNWGNPGTVGVVDVASNSIVKTISVGTYNYCVAIH